jgi:tetratricopeptide (TPR) repeat protein
MRLRRTITIVAVFACAAAQAWGPATQLAIVTTAVRVVSEDGTIPLHNLAAYVRQGAEAPAAVVEQLYPTFSADPITTIAKEMYLLQSVRGSRVDPYFAYRLGTLGKLVAEGTTPLATASEMIRREYNRDVDAVISGVQMGLSPRRDVDPSSYFDLVRSQATGQDLTIVTDYRGGVGFSGLARASLSKDATRSVDAVADVFHTIISKSASMVNVSRGNTREYTLAALDFYLERKKLAEAEEVYDRVKESGLLSAEVQKDIGDMFFEAGLYDQAMKEYQGVLAGDPDNRDVLKRVAEYHVRIGEDALKANRLEAARDDFRAAVEADKLHPDAQRKLFQTESRIAERDARLAESTKAIETAQAFIAQAESAAMEQNFAVAIAHLRNARTEYEKVTSEFPDEAQTASAGMRSIDSTLTQYNQDFITNAQRLSGAGADAEARRLAAAAGPVAPDAFHKLIERELDAGIDRLRQELTKSPLDEGRR